MEKELDFSLPEKKVKKSCANAVVIVLLVVLIVLTAANYFSKRQGASVVVGAAGSSLSAEQTKELASRLEARSLYEPAARLWQDYLVIGGASGEERARILFRIGTLLEKASLYDQAIEQYYRSEVAAKVNELEPMINSHIKDCFEKLGKFSALQYEMKERTSIDPSVQTGQVIVAEIGAEKITEAELDAAIEEAIDNQLVSMAVFMTAEQLNLQKEKLMGQYKSPEAKMQFLQVLVGQQIFYREGLEEGLGEQPRVEKLIEEMTRGIIGQQLMNQRIAEKVNITETDLETYYKANKDKYIEPADEEKGTAERQKEFSEVRDQVAEQLIKGKSNDVQQEYLKQLMDKYDVVIHTSVFSPAAGKDSQGEQK